MIHSFLLIGQSNAAGRGFLHEAPALDSLGGRLKVLRNGRWQTMYRPVNPDRAFSGTCFAESFAKAYAESHPDVEVGIIPCADGGTKLSQWMPGELLFDNAVHCAKLAMRTSRVVGILWHQGEGDCAPDLYPNYAERFFAMMDTLRRELGTPDIPLLVGGLGDFLASCSHSENLKNYGFVNEQLEKIGREYPHCAFVSAEGLPSNPDNLHFCAAALEEFGIRYYTAFQKIAPAAADVTEPLLDDSHRSEMEAL